MTIHLSCGHEAEDGCLGVCVEYADEQCVAGEGFVPCTVEAVYCHKCAMDLAAAEERAKIVAYLRESADWHDANDDGLSGFGYIAQADRESANLIEAKDHL